MTDKITEIGSGDRAGWMRVIEAAVRRVLPQWTKVRAGVNGGSLRVGSGAAALATFDGIDGVLSADGATAAIFWRDRADATKWAAWYENATVRLSTTQTADVWVINATTGLIAQDALTAMTAGTNISLGAASFSAATCGSRVVKPTGQVYVQMMLTATGAVGVGGVVATLAAGHRPIAGNLPFGARKAAGGVLTYAGVFVNPSGQITTEVALASTDTLTATFTFMAS